MQPSLLFELEHQSPGCLVADNGEKISLGRHNYRHTGRGLLCAGLTPGEPDTFQDNRTGQLMLFGFQTGHEGLTPQSILLFKTERHQPAQSRYRLRQATQTRCRSELRSGVGATLLLVWAEPGSCSPPHCGRACPTRVRAGRLWPSQTWKTASPDSAPPFEARGDSSQDDAPRRGL